MCQVVLITDGRSARDHFGSTDVSGLHFMPRDSHSRNWSSVFGVFCLLADFNKTLFLKCLCVTTKLFFSIHTGLVPAKNHFQPRLFSSQNPTTQSPATRANTVSGVGESHRHYARQKLHKQEHDSFQPQPTRYGEVSVSLVETLLLHCWALRVKRTCTKACKTN